MDTIIKEDETLDDLQLNGIHIIQKKKSFRFGVDAVLLGNFPKINKPLTVVDLCSGTGIVAFIIAGKTRAQHITGIEIQQDMVEMAKRTIKYNKLEDKIGFICGDLKNLEMLNKFPKVDLVTVNPPYKLKGSGLISVDRENAIARHEICCNLEDVIIACKVLLKDYGKMYMVHRPERLADVLCLMRKYRIEPKRIRMVYPNCKKAPNIVLIEGQKYGGTFLKWEPPLFVYDESGKFSDELNNIYGRSC